MQVKRLTPTFGAAVTDVNLANLSDSGFKEVMQVWHAHRGLMAFPKQNISDDGLLSFSRRIGALDLPPNQEHGRQSPEGYPEIYVVSNVKDKAGLPIGALGDGEAVWHTDMSYEAKPPFASMLTARELQNSDVPDLLGRVLELYVRESPNEVARLERAVADGEGLQIKRAAHSLKSSSANIGATVLSRYCAELEVAGRDDKIETARELCAKLSAEHKRVQAALNVELAALAEAA